MIFVKEKSSRKKHIAYSSLFFVGIIIVLLGASFFVQPQMAALTANNETILLDRADTKFLQERGLGGRDRLEPDRGMIFIFNRPDNYGFWMKDMKFSIDIVWLDQDFRVVHIEHNVSPDTYPTVFYPSGPVRYVIELEAGRAEKLGIREGEVVSVSL